MFVTLKYKQKDGKCFKYNEKITVKQAKEYFKKQRR